MTHDPDLHKHKTINGKRVKQRAFYCEALNIIKQHNQRGEPIGFVKLSGLVSAPREVAKFLFEAESWAMIESKHEETDNRATRKLLTVTKVGNAFLEHCKKKIA